MSAQLVALACRRGLRDGTQGELRPMIRAGRDVKYSVLQNCDVRIVCNWAAGGFVCRVAGFDEIIGWTDVASRLCPVRLQVNVQRNEMERPHIEDIFRVFIAASSINSSLGYLSESLYLRYHQS